GGEAALARGVGFVEKQGLVRPDVLQGLLSGVRPLDLDPAGGRLRPQAEVQTDVAGAEIAAVRIDFAELSPAPGGHTNFGADAEPVALAAPRAHGQPVTAVPSVVAQEQGRAAAVGDHDIEIAIVIEIEHRGAP